MLISDGLTGSLLIQLDHNRQMLLKLDSTLEQVNIETNLHWTGYNCLVFSCGTYSAANGVAAWNAARQCKIPKLRGVPKASNTAATMRMSSTHQGNDLGYFDGKIVIQSYLINGKNLEDSVSAQKWVIRSQASFVWITMLSKKEMKVHRLNGYRFST